MRSSKVVWVNDLIMHVLKEGTRLFEGTGRENDWVVYHDALSAWWDPHAQALMKRCGFENRQIRAYGSTALQILQ
jgi:hypothetical protein